MCRTHGYPVDLELRRRGAARQARRRHALTKHVRTLLRLSMGKPTAPATSRDAGA